MIRFTCSDCAATFDSLLAAQMHVFSIHPGSTARWEQEAQAEEKTGNAHLANGLGLKARSAFKRADSIRRDAA